MLKDDPNWEAVHIQGQGNGYLFCNRASTQSVTLERMIAGPFPDFIYRSPKRARRHPGNWVGVGYGFRRKLPADWEREFVPDRTQLLTAGAARRDPVAEKWVAEHIAYRDGDAEVRAALHAKWDAELEHIRNVAAALHGWGLGGKCLPSRWRHGQRNTYGDHPARQSEPSR